MSRVVVELLVLVGIHAAIAWSLHAWGKWVALRQRGTGWRYAAVMPVGAFWLAVIGIAVASFFLVHTWRLVNQGAPAAEKATMLAEGISATLNLTATFAALSGVLYLASVVAFAVGTLRRPV